MAISSSDFQNLARAVSAYSDEAYTLERKLISTALVGTDARISGGDEDFFGTVRWYKPLGSTLTYDADADNTDGSATLINIATQDSTEGRKTSISTETAQYIKTVRTHGADQFNVQQVISGQDGLAKIARDFGETQARDQDAAMTAIMNGVSDYEADRGSAGGQESPDSLLEGSTRGFYVDLEDTDVQAFYAGDNGRLIDDAQTGVGDKVSPLLAASSIAFSDYEPEFMYLIVQPSEYLKLKIANIIDDDHVVDGNVSFETILSGKYRLIVSRKAFRSQAGKTGVSTTAVNTSFLALPGVISLTNIAVPNPVAFDRDESVGRGTGTVEAWYRWGYVMHPRGYDWVGATGGFVTNTDTATRGTNGAVVGYEHVVTSGTQRFPWDRKADLLNLGILPIYHV